MKKLFSIKAKNTVENLLQSVFSQQNDLKTTINLAILADPTASCFAMVATKNSEISLL
jgi:hypothetical protein